MAQVPVEGTELARRLEAVATRYLVERYSGPGNPMQCQILRLGSLIATKVPFVPSNPLMNAVHGLEDPADLPRVLAFYAETGQPCWVELPPHVEPRVSEALIAHGFAPASRKAVLHGAIPSAAAFNQAVNVSAVSAADFDAFLDTLNRGFGSPESMLPALRRNQRFWFEVPHWRLYLARLGDEAAGAAVLAIDGELGYLAAAAVLPPFRGRGVHTALLARRLGDAAAAGCAFATGQAELSSTSHRNQERAGLALAHVRQDWTNAR